MASSLLTVVAIIAAVQTAEQVTVPSLEWLTDSSDSVVVGQIREVKPESVGGGFAVTIDRTDSLKGMPQDTFLARGDDALLKAWQEKHTALVWFLQKDPAGFFVADPLADRTAQLDFKQFDGGYLSANFALCWSAKEILGAVRKEAAAEPTRNDASIALEIPSYLAFRTKREGRKNTLILPSNERVEAFARSLITPTGGFLYRQLGVDLVSHFKSDRTVKLLQSVQRDPSEPAKGNEEYDVRGHARQVLQSWGIQPLPPIRPSPLPPTSKRAIRIVINGKEVSFKGLPPPRVIGGRVYTKVCSISAALGVFVGGYELFNGHGVTIDIPALKLEMPRDSAEVWVNSEPEPVANPAREIDGNQFYPVRYVVEKLGFKVKWDPAKSTVYILGTPPKR